MGKKLKVKKDEEIKNASQVITWRGWFVIAAAVAGLGICLYLYSFHIALLLGEIKGGLLCGADNGLGCNSVSSSPYSSLLGLPLALWGTGVVGRHILCHTIHIGGWESGSQTG
jgi:uncharacterized membrane protein